MYCPTCGQEQKAENVRFCSRCGFLLTGISEVVANNGAIPERQNQNIEIIQDSPRKKGIKQGAMILLVGMLLVVPLISLIHIMTNSEPFIAGIATIISFFGGILRMVYAMMFESKYPISNNQMPGVFEQTRNFIESKKTQQALPPQQSIPASDYVSPPPGSWRTTNNLVSPNSITDETTKTLYNKENN